MNAIILIASVVLPILPVVLFPTRFFGRGLPSTLFGAALVVGMMMVIYWGLSSLGGTNETGADPAALAGVSDADLSALEKLF